MVMVVVKMGWRGEGVVSACTSLNFNVKVYRFGLPQATTIESSASASCGAWMSVGGKDVFYRWQKLGRVCIWFFRCRGAIARALREV